jgi:hypothetical protein
MGVCVGLVPYAMLPSHCDSFDVVVVAGSTLAGGRLLWFKCPVRFLRS